MTEKHLKLNKALGKCQNLWPNQLWHRKRDREQTESIKHEDKD